jgi:hypothetical protein
MFWMLYCNHYSCDNICISMRFVAFLVTEYDEVLSGYQPGQMVERWENWRFKVHLCPRPRPSTLRTRTEMVFETLFFSPLNHLTWLIAQENFIILVPQVNIACMPIHITSRYLNLINFSNFSPSGNLLHHCHHLDSVSLQCIISTTKQKNEWILLVYSFNHLVLLMHICCLQSYSHCIGKGKIDPVLYQTPHHEDGSLAYISTMP